MTLRSSDLQPDDDLDSICHSCDVIDVIGFNGLILVKNNAREETWDMGMTVPRSGL